MKHVTIRERYENFLSHLPMKDRTPEAEQVIRLVYYVGASHMNDFMTDELTRLPDDVGVARIEMMQAELRQFAQVEAGRLGFTVPPDAFKAPRKMS